MDGGWKPCLEEAVLPSDGRSTGEILEPGGSEFTTPAGGATRHRKPLNTLRWCDLHLLFSDSVEGWTKHKAPRLGAALAFYTLLSLTPLLLVVISIVGLVFGRKSAEHQIVQQIQLLVGAQAATASQALLNGAHNATHGVIATVIGSVTLLFGGSGVLIELRDALNTIWEVPTTSLTGVKKVTSFIKERLFSFALVLAIGFLLVVSLAVSTWIAALGQFSSSLLPAPEIMLNLINLLVSFVVITLLFAAIYKLLPDVKLEWRDVVLGGAATSLLFSVGKFLLALYLGKASFASTYGAFASIVVLVLWVYYSGQIFFFGAELTKSFANRYGSHPSLHPGPLVVKEAAPDNPAIPEPKIIIPSGEYRSVRSVSIPEDRAE
jgi:membrane protein